MTTSESHLRAWVDQAIRPVLREILRDELADILPNLNLAPPPTDANPYGDFNWLKSTCPGVPVSTLRIKSAAGEIPGIVKFGKRVLYDKAAVLNYLQSQTRQQRPNAAELDRIADAQISRQLAKKGGAV